MRQQRKEEIMAILYANTRDASEKVTASQAILNGLAKHGGLYVPTEIPKLDIPVEELAKMSYQETAYAVMSRFLTDFTEEELKNCIDRAYDSKFDTPEIAPCLLSGAVPWRNHCIQRYGIIHSSAFADHSSPQK